MKQRLANLEQLTADLKQFLPQYLQEHGIDTSTNFSCINPKHTDNKPSMTCRQYPTSAYCFSCGQTADLFTAAHLLEGKPIRGREFIEDNVLYFAKKYGLTVQLEEFTQDEIYEYNTYRAYELAAEMVANPELGDYTLVNKELERRGWCAAKMPDWGIGTIDISDLKERLKSSGFEVRFLDSIDLTRSNLFNENHLIFTIFDDRGRPVGFSARNLKYDGSEHSKKYNNTRVTGVECNIFKKSERLYGFEIAKDARPPLYIFEGPSDVITARHFGLMNCCCALGTSFTDHHINLLKRYGQFNIVFVFDGDQAGENAIQRILDHKLAQEKDFRIKLIQLPAGIDPDELLRSKGVDEFVRLKKWSAFEWRITKFVEQDDELDGGDVAKKMVPIIATEPSYIDQERMAREVSKLSGIELATILSEVRRIRSEKEAAIQDKKRAAIESILSQVRLNPDSAELALAECHTAIEDINKEVNPGGKDADSTLGIILAQKEFDENRSGEFAGFHLRPDGLMGLGNRLNDDWRKDTWVCCGGSEQSGKTTCAAQMAYEIASNPTNNATVIYHSIDDPAKFILYKWVTNAAYDTKLLLNYVGNPNYWIKQGIGDNIMSLREIGYRDVINLVQDDRLVLRDASNGGTLAYGESLVRHYRERHPDRNIVLMIDNFHKLPDYGDIKGHERVKRLSNHVKNMAVRHHITILSTVEYRKLYPGEKPSNQALAETRSISYDASVIIHLYNDLHNKDEDAIVVHEENGIVMPRIWCKFGKNKVSGYEGTEYLDLYPAAGILKAVERTVAIQDARARKQFLQNKDRDEDE